MPPQSRGGALAQRPSAIPHGAQSRSTPNLPTLRSLEAERERSSASNSSSATASLRNATPQTEPPSPSEGQGASVEDLSLESGNDPRSLSSSDDDDEGAENEENAEEEETATKPTQPPSRPLPHRSRSHTYLTQSMFAPPFYGRPPTPLPPSPSLTSLLRPNFSSQNSRPTTPDPSSDEGVTSHPNGRGGGGATGTQTPNSAAASTLTSSLRLSAKPPVSRASPKVPTYEYYGFTLYLTSTLFFLTFLLWSFLPAPFLHQLGIWYYPDRWWALAIPAWCVMATGYIYVALACWNVEYLTLGMGSVECFVDEAGVVGVVDGEGKLVEHEVERGEVKGWRERSPEKKRGSRKGGKGKGGRRSRQGSVTNGQLQVGAGDGRELDWRGLWNEGTDAVMDIPIGGVCEILYGQRDEDEMDGA